MPLLARLSRLLDSLVDRVQRITRSAALVLGSILVATSVCFDSDSCDLGLTIGFVKIIELKRNKIKLLIT